MARKRKRKSQPVRIGEILPDVMADILSRCEGQKKRRVRGRKKR